MGNLDHVFIKFEKRKDRVRISMQTPLENPLITPETFNQQF